MGIHTEGGVAVEMSLITIESAIRATPRVDNRHRIEHCRYPTPESSGQMAALGVIPVNHPNLLVDPGDDFIRHLRERAHHVQPIREVLATSIRPVLSSAAVLSSLRLVDTISAAMTRHTRAELPNGADQRLTLDQAFRAPMIDATTATGTEDQVGSYQMSKFGEVAIIDGDLEATPPERLASLGTWMTFLDEVVVFSADATASQQKEGRSA